MNALSNRKAWTLGLSLGAIGVGSIIAACSGSSTGNGNNSNPVTGDGSTTPSGDAGAPVTCASSTLNILFSPMYSAFIPGSTAHTFQIPAVLDDGSQATWGSDNPSVVSQMPDSTTGGTMITITGTGTVNIVATKSDGTCGSAPLNITTTFTEADWQIGSSRYNDGVALHVGGGGGGGGFEGGRPEGGGGGGMFNSEAGSFLEQEGGTACTNCHGPTANSGPPFNFSNVAHTPEQTGGFSDDELIQIVLDGIVPDGGYFDPNVVIPDASADPTGAQQARAYKLWQSFHRWGAAYGGDITQDEQNGVIVYLRSLQPEPQAGTSNFGGGFGDGGRHHHDGGGFGQMDTGAGPTPDSGGGSDATGD